MRNRKSKLHKENMFTNYLWHNLKFISISICQDIEFASKYQYNNAFALSYKQYYVRVYVLHCLIPAQ